MLGRRKASEKGLDGESSARRLESSVQKGRIGSRGMRPEKKVRKGMKNVRDYRESTFKLWLAEVKEENLYSIRQKDQKAVEGSSIHC